jgi:hypothetical protein
VISLLGIGIGVGLASVAGVRAFLPLAIAALFATLGLLELPSQAIGVGEGVLFGGLAALAVVEIALDKIRSIERVFNVVMVPVRAAAGALAFTVTGLGLGADSLPWLVVGAVVAGAVAVLKVVLRPPAKADAPGASASFLSLIEDVAAALGAVVGVFVPFLPLLLVAFLLFFFYRLRRRRGRTYRGLRILRD